METIPQTNPQTNPQEAQTGAVTLSQLLRNVMEQSGVTPDELHNPYNMSKKKIIAVIAIALTKKIVRAKGNIITIRAKDVFREFPDNVAMLSVAKYVLDLLAKKEKFGVFKRGRGVYYSIPTRGSLARAVWDGIIYSYINEVVGEE